MPCEHIWSEADVAAVPADAHSVQLHRVTPEIVAALNRRPRRLDIDLAGDDLDDDQVALLAEIAGLRAVDLFGGKGLSDRGLKSILSIPGLEGLALLSAAVSEDALATLPECPTLTSLVFDNTEHVTDRVIEAVGRLPGLRTLLLEAWELSHGALEHLAQLPALRLLQLCVNPVGVDHGPVFVHRDLRVLRLYSWGGKKSAPEADRVVGMIWDLPSLEELVLSGFRASTSTLEGVRSLRELNVLDVGANEHVRDPVAQAIAELPKLQRLRMGRTAVTDEGLDLLARAPSLTGLRLFECPYITGEGVLHLAALQTLEYLCLKGCPKVDMRSASRLAQLLPDCMIELPDGTRSWSQERIEAWHKRLVSERRSPC